MKIEAIAATGHADFMLVHSFIRLQTVSAYRVDRKSLHTLSPNYNLLSKTYMSISPNERDNTH